MRILRAVVPPGYNEAPFVFKRNGTYCFMWSEATPVARTTVSRTPPARGRWAGGCNGAWCGRSGSMPASRGPAITRWFVAPGTNTRYIAYHRFAVPAGNGTNREIAIDRLEFNADGMIRPIVPTL